MIHAATLAAALLAAPTQEATTGQAEVEPEPPPPRVQPEPPRDQPPPPAKPVKWWTDESGIGLTMGGLATSIVGAALLGSAYAIESHATSAGSEEIYRDDIERAQKREAIGITLLSVGGALLIGGVARFIVVGRRSKRARVGFAIRF